MDQSTIAKPYAQAIFDITRQSGGYSDWSEFLNIAGTIMSDAATKKFVATPNANKEQKKQLICTLLEKAKGKTLSNQESAFIQLILDNGRTDAMSSISNAFESVVSSANKSKNFVVLSAYELSDAELKTIVNELSVKHNTTVSVDTFVDATLKGGAVVKEGDKVIDTSIKARVGALSTCLSVN